MTTSLAAETLTLQVLQDGQIVTYRKLARELQVHVNTAKNIMAAFYEENKSKCHATFLVTGNKHRNNIDSALALVPTLELLVKLVPESELTNVQSGLDNAAYHIYSVEPRPIEGDEALVLANILAGNCRDMADLSAVGSSVTMMDVSGKSHEVVDRLAQMDVAMPEAKPGLEPNTAGLNEEKEDAEVEAEIGADDARMVSVKPKIEKAPAAKKPTKTAKGSSSTAAKPTDVKSFFGRQLNKKPAATFAPAKNINVKQVPQQDSSSLSATDVKAKIRSSPPPPPENDDVDVDVEMHSAEESEPEPETAKSRVEDMFADDNDGNDDREDSDALSRNSVKQETQSELATDSQLIMDSVVETDPDIEMGGPSQDNGDSQLAQSLQASPESNCGQFRARHRRKVTKVKHTKNKRGMLVTETVEEWESYSESESEKPPAKRLNTTSAKSLPAAEPSDQKKSESSETKKGATKSSAPQRSILSFFGKKK
ncbi:CDC27 protein [Kickxella alabastrina]|uniref:CDC27 protein n=1 Tax=Kickxella alabastrina TaxID=61397 RepID=A0ACC1IFJ3_9FUNG|nr:CDC27 protein [Kickxella alabastrina]